MIRIKKKNLFNAINNLLPSLLLFKLNFSNNPYDLVANNLNTNYRIPYIDNKYFLIFLKKYELKCYKNLLDKRIKKIQNCITLLCLCFLIITKNYL